MEAEIKSLYADGMVRIVVRPTWAKLTTSRPPSRHRSRNWMIGAGPTRSSPADECALRSRSMTSSTASRIRHPPTRAPVAVRAVGVEPTWALADRVLSPARLPFRHARKSESCEPPGIEPEPCD